MSAKYKISLRGTIVRLADNAHVPSDIRNGDYQEYLRWVAGGGVAEMEDAPPVGKRRRDAFLALSHAYEAYVGQERGYTPGWRSKSDKYDKLATKTLKNGTEAQKAAATQLQALLALVDAWDDALDDYYEARGLAIMASATPEAETWDFPQFDAADPNVTLVFHLRPLVRAMKAVG